jgi:hypothetical protein
MNEITVEEIKEGVKSALLEMDIIIAKSRLSIWEEMITEKGFKDYSMEDISEYYQIKHIVEELYKQI